MSGYKTSADCWWDQTRGKKRRVSRRELKMWGGGGDGGEEVVMVTTSPAAGGDDVTLPHSWVSFLVLVLPTYALTHACMCATWRRHAGTKPVSSDSTRPINTKRPLWAKTCCSLISFSFFNEQITVAFSVFFRTTDACSFKRIHCSYDKTALSSLWSPIIAAPRRTDHIIKAVCVCTPCIIRRQKVENLRMAVKRML